MDAMVGKRRRSSRGNLRRQSIVLWIVMLMMGWVGWMAGWTTWRNIPWSSLCTCLYSHSFRPGHAVRWAKPARWWWRCWRGREEWIGQEVCGVEWLMVEEQKKRQWSWLPRCPAKQLKSNKKRSTRSVLRTQSIFIKYYVVVTFDRRRASHISCSSSSPPRPSFLNNLACSPLVPCAWSMDGRSIRKSLLGRPSLSQSRHSALPRGPWSVVTGDVLSIFPRANMLRCIKTTVLLSCNGMCNATKNTIKLRSSSVLHFTVAHWRYAIC